jgi:hypothetical protein
MFTMQCCQLQSWASFKPLTALRKFLVLGNLGGKRPGVSGDGKHFVARADDKLNALRSPPRYKIIQFFYLE